MCSITSWETMEGLGWCHRLPCAQRLNKDKPNLVEHDAACICEHNFSDVCIIETPSFSSTFT